MDEHEIRLEHTKNSIKSILLDNMEQMAGYQ